MARDADVVAVTAVDVARAAGAEDVVTARAGRRTREERGGRVRRGRDAPPGSLGRAARSVEMSIIVSSG